MHIVWINQHASLIGGAEHYIVKTAKYFRERGVQSTLLYDPNLPTSATMLEPFEGAFPLVDVLAQIKDLKADLVYMHQTRRPQIAQTLALSPIPAVEFFHDHWLFCLREQKYTAIGRQTCSRVASVAACYPCLGFVHRKPGFPGLALRTISDLEIEHRARKHFAGFVTGSTYMAEQAIAHGFDRSKVHVTPLYAEPPAIVESAESRDPQRLLFVGAILPYKGVDVLIEALSRTVFPAHLDVIGDGAYLPTLRGLVDKLGIGHRVTFLGKLNRDEIDDHYRRATCLVLPSRTPESFGIVGAEAMSHGLPAIVSDVGGALEWLEPGRTGLTFPINDVRALARSMDLIISSPALARAMGKAAYERYHAHFRPEHHVDRILGIFDDICAKHRRARNVSLGNDLAATDQRVSVG